MYGSKPANVEMHLRGESDVSLAWSIDCWSGEKANPCHVLVY